MKHLSLRAVALTLLAAVLAVGSISSVKAAETADPNSPWVQASVTEVGTAVSTRGPFGPFDLTKANLMEKVQASFTDAKNVNGAKEVYIRLKVQGDGSYDVQQVWHGQKLLKGAWSLRWHANAKWGAGLLQSRTDTSQLYMVQVLAFPEQYVKGPQILVVQAALFEVIPLMTPQALQAKADAAADAAAQMAQRPPEKPAAKPQVTE